MSPTRYVFLHDFIPLKRIFTAIVINFTVLQRFKHTFYTLTVLTHDQLVYKFIRLCLDYVSKRRAVLITQHNTAKQYKLLNSKSLRRTINIEFAELTIINWFRSGKCLIETKREMWVEAGGGGVAVNFRRRVLTRDDPAGHTGGDTTLFAPAPCLISLVQTHTQWSSKFPYLFNNYF